MQEGFALRNQPINEIMALLGGSQVNMPQFAPFSRQGIGAAQPGGYMAQNYANQLQQSSAQNQGLFGLAGAGLGAIGQAGGLGMFMGSDPRLKTGITPTGQRLAGLPVYSFTYRNHPGVPRQLRGTSTVGVMSTDARELHPDAVRVADNGYDEVNYALLLRRH
jgi:hypothetical protein